MTNSYNLGGLSRMNVDPTLGGVVDGVDFPHSGILKSLSVGTQGNYAIIDGAIDGGSNNFDIVQSGTTNTIFTVATGKVMRDGKIISIVADGTVNVFTQGTPSTFDEPTSGNAYYLLVVDSSNALAMRDNGNKDTADTVPQLTAGDIPIAVIKLEAGGTVAQRQIQFLTTAKAENSLSIGRDNTGYTESLTIENDGSDNTTIKSTVSDKDIVFKVNDGGVDTEVIRIDGSTSMVGVGTDTPLSPLHIKGTGTGDIVTIETSDDGSVEGPNVAFIRESTSPAQWDSLGRIEFIGKNNASTPEKIMYSSIKGQIDSFADGAESGTIVMQNMVAGTLRNVLMIKDSDVIINDDSQDINFRIESNNETNMLFVDGGNDRVGIGTATPSSTLEVAGKITSGASRRGLVSKTSADVSYNISATTDHYIFASATTGMPPTNGPLDLTLPAIGATDLGLSYRIVVTSIDAAGSPPNLDAAINLNYDTGDTIHDARGGILASGGASYALSAKTYDLICTEGTVWTLIQLD